jgi:hypothetical protein
MKRSEMLTYMTNVWNFACSTMIKDDLSMKMDTLLKSIEAQGMLPPEIKIKQKRLLIGTKIEKINKWESEK